VDGFAVESPSSSGRRRPLQALLGKARDRR